jgi:hypothetical protein
LLGRTGSVSSGAVLDNFPREYIGESNLVCNAHLFFLQFHASSFEASWQGEIGLLFSVLCKIGRLSMGWGYRMSQSLILIDALSSACWGKKTQEKKKKTERESFYFPEPDTPFWLCCTGLSWWSSAIEEGSNGQSLNVSCT